MKRNKPKKTLVVRLAQAAQKKREQRQYEDCEHVYEYIPFTHADSGAFQCAKCGHIYIKGV